MIEQSTYEQIDSFVEQRIGKSKLHEIKFYVDSETAKDKASFIKFLIQNNEIMQEQKQYKVIDLCYGSGNLTAHILGDCTIEFSELILNDVNTNDRNNQIQIGEKKDYDFLDASNFHTKYDLIVFNPQIGGKDTYPEGIVEFEKIEPIMSNSTLEDYLISHRVDVSLLDISVNETEKSILIHSNSMTKTEMNEIFKNIKIFNYYDIFYQSKESKIEGSSTKIVQFRKTLENISHENSIVIFYGEMNYFAYLFTDYTNIKLYLQDSGKQLFVLTKGEKFKKCYEKKENKFVENENCEIEKSSSEEDLDIGELMQELENNKAKNDFKNVLTSKASVISDSQLDNEVKFQEWWYANTEAVNSYNKPLDRKTKIAYYNGLKRFNKEFSLNIFAENDIEKLSIILKSLEKDGANYEYNRKEGYNPSNGLKQYIEFLNIEQNNKNGYTFQEKISENKVGNKVLFSSDNAKKSKKEWDNFRYRNILFKGVPGTGKSWTIDNIIKDSLGLKTNDENVLRINIHSASSNSDLMQGIGISSSNGEIQYSEKQGLILDIIKRATLHPNQPFVLILEEIQENSLNELIGDLIYLIEDEKRAELKEKVDDQEYDSYEALINKLIDEDSNIPYVEVPYLVNDSTDYKKMIMPSNLFIFCTSNYRDDKKIIEDNLLRRFEVIEIYPNKNVASGYAQAFLESLNISILTTMQENHDIHPDRYMIGHAIWKDVEDDKSFYRALLKLITEFKDIREIEFDIFKKITINAKFPDNIEVDMNTKESYFDLIQDIQKKIDYGFLD